MCKIQERRAMNHLCESGSSVHAEEDFEASHKSRTRGSLTAQIRHDACDNDLLHIPAPQSLFQRSVVECVVLGFRDHNPPGCVQQRADSAVGRIGAKHIPPPTGHHPCVAVCVAMPRENNRATLRVKI